MGVFAESTSTSRLWRRICPGSPAVTPKHRPHDVHIVRFITHTCMHAYILSYIRTCMHTFMHAYILTYTHIYLLTKIYTCMHTYMYNVYMHAYMHTYLHTYMNKYTSTYMNTYMHTLYTLASRLTLIIPTAAPKFNYDPPCVLDPIPYL
jgi:hypothetical protein